LVCFLFQIVLQIIIDDKIKFLRSYFIFVKINNGYSFTIFNFRVKTSILSNQTSQIYLIFSFYWRFFILIINFDNLIFYFFLFITGINIYFRITNYLKIFMIQITKIISSITCGIFRNWRIPLFQIFLSCHIFLIYW